TLPTIFNKTNESSKQDESLATLAPNISRELERINWHNDHEMVYHHVSGLHLWPVAYRIYHNVSMKIWWVDADELVYKSAVPGEIIKKDESSFTVACGDEKAIQITEIQPAGKKRMLVEEYLRGADDAIEIGTIME